jgi:hypothetical protein
MNWLIDWRRTIRGRFLFRFRSKWRQFVWIKKTNFLFFYNCNKNAPFRCSNNSRIGCTTVALCSSSKHFAVISFPLTTRFVIQTFAPGHVKRIRLLEKSLIKSRQGRSSAFLLNSLFVEKRLFETLFKSHYLISILDLRSNSNLVDLMITSHYDQSADEI